MKGASNGAAAPNTCEGERRTINPELWYACAGPLVMMPQVGSLVVYFPQGHSEQVAASMHKDMDAHTPNYPNLPSKLICLLHNVTLHADPETDDVYAQMTLQPVSSYNKEALLASELALKQTRPPTEFFCKTLTASDTSTHGGFSVPRRAAEKIFPHLDFSMQPPAQEIQARDLHDNLWTFRHIYRGQPKRHLLTTGWSLFVSGKRLFAGDSVLFIRDQKQQLLLGIRRANRQPANNISSSVLSSDSMHIGLLAAAAHAAANHSPFTVFYNPRASPSEFVIPFAKYQKAVYSNQISLGMRFRMMFETEELGTRRYMGTITGISDLDPVRWKNSQWRNLQVGWDESAAGERHSRVSLWEIEPVIAPFFICPPFFRKRPRQPGMPDDDSSEMENLFQRAMPWLGEEICIQDSQTQSAIMPGISLVQWMNMQQNPSLINQALQTDYLRSLTGSAMQNIGASDLSRQLGSLQAQVLQQNNLQVNDSRITQQAQQIDELAKLSIPISQVSALSGPPQEIQDLSMQQKHQLVNQGLQFSQTQSNAIQPPVLAQTQVQPQQQPQVMVQSNHLLQTSLQQNQQQYPQQLLLQQQQQLQLQYQQQQQLQLQYQQQQSRIPVKLPNEVPQQLSDQQIQLQLLQKLQQQQSQQLQQQQQQLLLPQPRMQQPQFSQIQEYQKTLIDETQQLVKGHSLAQQSGISQPCTKINSQFVKLSPSSQNESHIKPQHQQGLLGELPVATLPATPATNLIPAGSSSLLAAGGSQSGLTDDIPSCSTSPSANNGIILPNPRLNKSHHLNPVSTENISQSGVTVLSPNSLEAAAVNISISKELRRAVNDVRPSIPISKERNQGVALRTYVSNKVQMDFLDTTSSATSVCLSQTDGNLHPSYPSFNQPSLLRDAPPVCDIHDTDPRNNSIFGVNIDVPLGIHMTTDSLLDNSINSGKFQNHMSGDVVANFNTSKDSQQELTSTMVSHSFGIPDMGLNPIDPVINDNGFLSNSSWVPAPPPPLQRMRTYTKVYKRGAVGRSIDIAHYSGYDELKYDLARMFSIEGQLEDRQRIGWKLVYVDHENDVLLVGDDPWEEFVNCVRCIKILSPQEVQQMSLDVDLGDNNLPNQACSSSDGGNAWRGHYDQDSGNPTIGSYDRLE